MAFSPPSPEVTCSQPPNIANGLHSGQSLTKFSVGVTVYYSCKDGYALVGNMSINCTETGVWSRPLPRCEGGWMLHCSVWGWQKGCCILWLKEQCRHVYSSEEMGGGCVCRIWPMH